MKSRTRWQTGSCAHHDALFEPLQLKGLKIRNRFLVRRTMLQDWRSEASSAITLHPLPGRKSPGMRRRPYTASSAARPRMSPENSCYYSQINGAVEAAVVPQYRRMAAAIHEQPTPVALVQLTHGGRQERWDIANWLPACFGLDATRDRARLVSRRDGDDHDIRRPVVAGFRITAAQSRPRRRRGRYGNILPGATLIEQILGRRSSIRRTDRYGGSFENLHASRTQ